MSQKHERQQNVLKRKAEEVGAGAKSPMRPACHLDTQNTVFWQFGHPKIYVRI